MAADGFTIGEVLNQLKEEFEDITISKIRFLESEGLIYPDRTESGYRKFTDDDVDRLRFILTAQRDHYLPLKVIREQLERLDSGEGPGSATAGVPAPSEPDSDHLRARRAAEIAQALEAVAAAERPLLEPPPEPVSLSLREFGEATGLDAGTIRDLRDYGIVGERGEELGPFDGDDLLAARAARELLGLGLEPRHLRMYRQFVDRELALFEQLVTPLLRQRNPEARRQATRQLEKLASLTGRMKRSLLARALRRYVHGA
ncbi:MAG TPA: MerR family transcriptional regulator [Egibacteraceae bacterium]|nr:MerR family transcriptional regulator [Egibacteraceae bacterium]